MDGITLACPGCGASVNIDAQTHMGICEYCGNHVYPRSMFKMNDAALSEFADCIKYFERGNFEEAKKHADNVLQYSANNAPAMFVRAYYDSLVSPSQNKSYLDEFFEEVKNIATDQEETKQLVKMFNLSKRKLESHEEQVLEWAVHNLNEEQLLNFADEFCPVIIGGRLSINYFSTRLISLYKELAEKCSIPKTCFALLQGIDKNPDSPIPRDEFFLRTRTKNFYNSYVLPVGEIISSMDKKELKEKFQRVYQAKLLNFETKMNGGKN